MDFLKLIVQLPAFKAIKNELCKNHTVMTIEHLLQGSPWAIKMFDSSTKIPEGVLMGSISHLGNFDECLDVAVNQDWGSFKGQHCLATVNVNVSGHIAVNEMKSIQTLPFKWAMCMPSSCAAADLEAFLTSALHNTVNVNPLECHVQGTRPLLPLDWLAIGILSFFGLLCFLSTAYDLTVTDPWSRKESLLIFSWYTNGKRLLNTARSDNTLHCLDGIRFLSIFWIILGHAYLIGPIYPTVNLLSFSKQIRNWGHVLIVSAVFSVDTFLLLSGVLVCYTFLEYGGRNFNLLIYFLRRYMRTTPMMAILILIYTSLITHMGSGPLWDSFFHTHELVHCKRYWWTAIFHIQNYVNPTEMCMVESWYLSVDMQLYLLSPLLLLPLLKRPKVGLILLQVVTAASTVSCFLQLHFNNTNKAKSFERDDLTENYTYAHTRATPWFIGMSLGYCLFHTMQWRQDTAAGTRRGLSKKVLGASWLLVTVCLLAPILVVHELLKEDYAPEHLDVQLYTTISRPIWSLGVSMVIFVCVTGYGGPVNTFLSWKFFVPLSRLTYSIYMLHMFFMRIKLASTTTPIYGDDLEKVMVCFSTMVSTTLLAVPASLTFESPIMGIQKLLLDAQKKKTRTQPEVSNTSHQEEKRNNDPPSPGTVVIPGSSISQELNTLSKYPSKFNISEENSVHNRMQ